MQVATAAERSERLFVETGDGVRQDGAAGEALAVAFGVWVAPFYAAAERAENRLGGFQFVGDFLSLSSDFTRAKSSAERSAC